MSINFKKPLKYYLGNCLILLALFILSVTYAPIVNLYIQPSQVNADKGSNFRIYIPKINAAAPIVEDIDPWNKAMYQDALKLGIASARGFALPDQAGGMFLFAHSSDYPWRMTRVNTPFFRLNELDSGDEILINRNNKEYKFSVVDKKEVWPNESQFLENLKEGDLVLQTCTPIGTDLKRLLIFAKEVN